MNEIDEEDRPIAGQISYFNILAQSISAINQQILAEKDPRDAAANLISDLPQEWIDEIRPQLDEAAKKYNNIIDYENGFLVRGTTENTKQEARKAIYLAGKKYSREIKIIVISLMKRKDILYQTKKKIEHGAISLYELTGEKPPEDND